MEKDMYILYTWNPFWDALVLIAKDHLGRVKQMK